MALEDSLGVNSLSGLPQLTGGSKPEDYSKARDVGALAKGDLAGLQTRQKEASETAKLKGQEQALTGYKTALEDTGMSNQINQVIEQRNKQFVPTQETAGDLSNLFTLTSLVGFMLGGAGKGHAQQALSAMNGMLEGHNLGNEDRYKKEKAIYEENSKALDKLASSLQEKKKEVLELAKTDYEAALLKAEESAHSAGAPFLAEIARKQGLVSYGEYADSVLKQIEKKEEATNKLKETSDRNKEQARHNLEMENHQRRLERIAGEKQKGTGVRQQQFVAQRVIDNLSSAASAAESIMQLPAGTTAGILPNLQTKDGMVNYMRNSAGRTMSSSEAKALETLFAGVTRNLAAIEASGAATGLVGLSTNIEKLIPRAGDTARDVALKMADIRRIATENVTPMINSGILLPDQATEAGRLISKIEKAIPFTTMDVVQSLQKGRPTIGEKGVEIATGGQLPKGIPPNSKKIGKTPEGTDVYQAPDGTKHTPE